MASLRSRARQSGVVYLVMSVLGAPALLYLPKTIGVLLLIASVGYVAMSFAFIGLPSFSPVANRFGMIMIQGELAVILWLLIMGASERVMRPVAASLATS